MTKVTQNNRQDILNNFLFVVETNLCFVVSSVVFLSVTLVAQIHQDNQSLMFGKDIIELSVVRFVQSITSQAINSLISSTTTSSSKCIKDNGDDTSEVGMRSSPSSSLSEDSSNLQNDQPSQLRQGPQLSARSRFLVQGFVETFLSFSLKCCFCDHIFFL